MTADAPPPGTRTVPPPGPAGTRLVLIRHGEAVCNLSGVIGGWTGCTGLTERGRVQAEALAARLARTGELASAGALYSSVLPRAIETARLLGPVWPDLELVTDCQLCELHPGDSDGLTWDQFAQRYQVPDWDRHPEVPLAPAAESWSGFVDRAAAALETLAERHPDQLVVVVTHAGVIEAAMLRFLPTDRSVSRLGLHTAHTSMTAWQRWQGRWHLLRYNDVACPPPL